MPEAATEPTHPPKTNAAGPARRRRAVRWAAGLGGAVALVFILLTAGLLALNTETGRSFLARRIAGVEAESGLNVQVGEIDGSLFGAMVIRDLRLRDPQGVFLTAPSVALDWRPLALLKGQVDIRALTAPSARLLRRPALRDTPRDPDKPLLPDIDISAGAVRLERLVIEPAVTGRRHVANFRGSADLDDQRLRLNARALAQTGPGVAGGDRLIVAIDATPAANRLRLELDLHAPADGLVDSYLALGAPLAVRVHGRGDWQRWSGAAAASLGEQSLADLRITATDGAFEIEGETHPGLLIEGQTARLLTPQVQVDFAGKLADRRLQLRLALASDALRLAAAGAIDLKANRFRDVKIDVRLREPGALAANLTGEDVALSLVLDGKIGAPQIAYDLTPTSLSLGEVTVEGLHASDRTRVDADRILVPVDAQARRVTGLNAAAGRLLTGLSIRGDLAISGRQIVSDNLRLQSEQIHATAVIAANLATGLYTGALKGRINDYEVDGIGRFAVVADANLTASGTGGFGLRGDLRITSRSLENEALRDALGGDGVLTANVALDADGRVTFNDLRLEAPDFRILNGRGTYGPGGLNFQANARSTQYGSLALTVGGTAQQPVLRLSAPSPKLGVQLHDVQVAIVGDGDAYRTEVTGRSPYGLFAGRATLRPGRPLTVDVGRFQLAGVSLAGRLTQTAAGPFAGVLRVSGSGLSGAVRLSAAGQVQRADAAIDADKARLALEPVIAIADGRMLLTALFNPDGPDVRADLNVVNLRRDDLLLSSARLRGHYWDGRGQAGLVLKGRQAAPLDLAANAAFTPGLVRVNMRGTVNGQSMRLAAPAEIRKLRAGWRLAPTRLLLPAGELILAGETGARTAIQARLRNIDLSLARTVWPELALEGAASGRIDASLPTGGGLPIGTARLQVENFSRVALATASPPVDITLRASLAERGGEVQALFHRNGAALGRLQARLSPRASGSWTERLQAARLAGGLRYSGPSDVLWALTGVSGHQVAGPIAVAADVSGTVARPGLRGVIRADDLRYANPAFGTRITDIAIRGRFTQSRLEITRLTGRAGAGAVTARGWVGLDAAAGFPMDLRVTLSAAQLARSDALGATVSGTLVITNSRARGGRIEGEFTIPEARYRIVRQGAAHVADLEGVRRRGDAAPRPVNVAPEPTQAAGGLPSVWRLDLRVRADNQIFVSGMGLETEWRTDLRVRGTVADPVISGALEVIRGTYTFAGRRLELNEAEIRFDGRQATNPQLDIAASTTVDGVTATVNVAGKAQNPQITFTSTPTLPQDEVLSRLLFGASAGQLSPTQALQVAAALNSLRSGGGGLNPLGKLRAATGADRLRILAADQATGREPALAAGRYLTRNLYVEVITDARGFTAPQLEIALSRTLSLLTQTSSFGWSHVELRYSRDY